MKRVRDGCPYEVSCDVVRGLMKEYKLTAVKMLATFCGDTEEAARLTRYASRQIAQYYCNAANPISAAIEFLTSSQYDEFVRIMLFSGEPFLTYYCCQLLEERGTGTRLTGYVRALTGIELAMRYGTAE